jgi:hypothetical protein
MPVQVVTDFESEGSPVEKEIRPVLSLLHHEAIAPPVVRQDRDDQGSSH